MLFITFTQAGDSIPYIRNFARRSLEMSEDDARHLQEALTEDTTIDRMNLSELARQFHVDVKQLPVIVLTDNIKSNQALIVPTSAKDVFDQLVLLGGRANRHDFRGSLDEIDSDRFLPVSEMIHLNKTLANLLADFMSRVQLKLDPSDIAAMRWNNDAVSKSIQRLWEMKDSDNTIQERDDELMDYSSKRIAQISIPDSNVLHPFQIAEQKLLGAEDVSLDMLYTYNLLSTVLDSNEIAQHHPDPRIRRYDYSALSLYLGKIFENELSYSIVQQMRELIGIPMPDNYVKYYRSSIRFVVQTGNNKEVNLNNSNRRRTLWIAPSIGEARAAYDRLRLVTLGTSLTIQRQHEVLWGYLNSGRNAASHRDPVDREMFMQFFNNFTEFLDDGFFGQLIQIKNQVKGEDSGIIEEQSVLTPLGSAMECESFDGKGLF